MLDTAQRPPHEPKGTFRRAGALTTWFVIGGVGYALLTAQGWEGRDRFWFIEPAMFAAFFIGVWLKRARGVSILRRTSVGRSALLYMLISWLVAMVVELKLGMADGGRPVRHLLTVQGFYWPFIVSGFVLIRRYGYTLPDLYYGGIAASFTESVLFGGMLTSTMLSPHFFLAPFLLGYYGLVYGVFLSIGVVVVDERSLWSERPKRIGRLRKIIYCFLAAFGSYLVFAAWGTLIGSSLSPGGAAPN